MSRRPHIGRRRSEGTLAVNPPAEKSALRMKGINAPTSHWMNQCHVGCVYSSHLGSIYHSQASPHGLEMVRAATAPGLETAYAGLHRAKKRLSQSPLVERDRNALARVRRKSFPNAHWRLIPMLTGLRQRQWDAPTPERGRNLRAVPGQDSAGPAAFRCCAAAAPRASGAG